MNLLAAVFAAILAGQVVLALLLRRAGRSMAQPPPRTPRRASRVRAVVPVEPGAEDVAACIEGLLAQKDIEVAVVVARAPGAEFPAEEWMKAEPRLSVVEGPGRHPSLPGRAGLLAAGAKGAQTEWLLFTEPDVELAKDAVARAVAAAEMHGAQLWSALLARGLSGLAELTVVPAFLQLSLAASQAARANGAVASGAFLLVQREGYEALGGHAALLGARDEVAGLARAFHRAGRKTTLARGMDLGALVRRQGLGELWSTLRDSLAGSMARPALAWALAAVQVLVVGAPLGSLLAVLACTWAGWLPREAGPAFWLAIAHTGLGLWIRSLVTRGFGVSSWPLVLQPVGALLAAGIALDAGARAAMQR